MRYLQLTFPVPEGCKFSDTVILPSNLKKFFEFFPEYEKYKNRITKDFRNLKDRKKSQMFECAEFRLQRSDVYN